MGWSRGSKGTGKGKDTDNETSEHGEEYGMERGLKVERGSCRVEGTEPQEWEWCASAQRVVLPLQLVEQPCSANST